MSKLLLTFTLVVTLSSALAFGTAAMAADALFSKTIEDLPLMEGMYEHDNGVQFSTSTGRIAEVIVDAPYSPDDVLTFYTDTLPQLGWTVLSPTTFQREGEVLTMTIEQEGSDVAVRFELAPQDQ